MMKRTKRLLLTQHTPLLKGNPIRVKPKGADEEEDLASMPDLEENTGILQHLPELEVLENL